MPVLRPIYEKYPAYRDGPAPEKFVGYGYLTTGGEVHALDDRALYQERRNK